MRLIIVAAAALSLAGCASTPKVSITHPGTSIAHKAPAVKQAAKPIEQPVEATTPNQVVKHRWYDRFMRHKAK